MQLVLLCGPSMVGRGVGGGELQTLEFLYLPRNSSEAFNLILGSYLLNITSIVLLCVLYNSDLSIGIWGGCTPFLSIVFPICF